MNPIFFATRSQFRKWLKEHHDKAQELWVGYYKKDSGRPSITWPESVDAALCFGWIDSIRKSLDTESYVNRFTPKLDASSVRQFRANTKAWDYFQSQAPWYRKTAIWWVVSAKKEETRKRRLATLMEDSARGRTIPPLTRPPSRTDAPSARRPDQS